MRLTSLAVVALATAALLAPTAPASHAADEYVRQPVAATTGCPGDPRGDAPIPGCGMVLDGAVRLLWDRERMPVEQALAAARLDFIGTPRAGQTTAQAAVSVWQQDSRGGWRAWASWWPSSQPGITWLERGQEYVVYTETPVAWSLPPRNRTSSIFANTQVVAFYGTPGVGVMGILGEYTPTEAMRRVNAVAAEYDARNGDRAVLPALHLITAVAQADPGWDGTYLGRLPIETVEEYARAAAEGGGILIVDIQIGWSDPLTEVRYYESVLRQPHVHLALDPEFATRRKGDPPGEAIGTVTSDEVDAVQRYLAGLVTTYQLPPKTLVVHQFRDDMMTNPYAISRVEQVDMVIDMDGWGPPEQKLDGYRRYAMSAYAEYAGFKLFYRWDKPLMTPAEVQALARPPDLVIYQ